MRVTPGDWRITAVQEAEICAASYHAAHESDRAVPEILSHYWQAFLAAEAALGAMVESELAGGMTLAEVTAACTLDGSGDVERLSRARAAGSERLRARLHS